MKNDPPAGNSGPGGTAFGGELESFGRLLRAVWNDVTSAPDGAAPNPQRIGLRLAAHLEGWLRDAASMPPWCRGLQKTPPYAQPASPFGFKISAPPAIAGTELLQAWQHTADLVLQWCRLQGQLALHWSTIARHAAEKFNLVVPALPVDLGPTNIRKLYDLWIDCAEQAYAVEVHTDAYCRTQAGLINVMAALSLEQRGHLERFARSCGMPTQSELDQLRAQLGKVQAELRAGAKRRSNRSQRRRASR